jgi:hypothetical protein
MAVGHTTHNWISAALIEAFVLELEYHVLFALRHRHISPWPPWPPCTSLNGDRLGRACGQTREISKTIKRRSKSRSLRLHICLGGSARQRAFFSFPSSSLPPWTPRRTTAFGRGSSRPEMNLRMNQRHHPRIEKRMRKTKWSGVGRPAAKVRRTPFHAFPLSTTPPSLSRPNYARRRHRTTAPRVPQVSPRPSQPWPARPAARVLRGPARHCAQAVFLRLLCVLARGV